jgi:NitT/TauT family transport system permease protein/taurine transport system permease protein
MLPNEWPAWQWLIAGGSVGLLALAWYLLTGPLELLSPVQFPSPEDAYESLVQLIAWPGYAGATLWDHILSSVELVLLGFAVAVATGTPLGLLMGRSRIAHAYLNSVFQLIRPIAPIAWIPLTILWFGLGTAAKVFVIWLAAFAPIVINTITGAQNVDPILVAAAKVHGASRRQILFDVVIPGSMPTIFTGLRVSLQACWMVLVASELVGSFTGLGHIMIIATRDLNPGMIFIAMACVSILGVLFTLALSQIENWLIPWRC